MRRQLLPALRMLVVLTVVVGLAYPLATLAFAQIGFKAKADGSLITRNGQVIGSSLLGQTFTGDRYFEGRPSAAGITASGTNAADGTPGDPTDPSIMSSGGANLGPTNPVLLDGVAQLVTAYRRRNGLADGTPVPVDAVTSSASGVDPQISVANARLQANRVARVRNLDVSVVNRLIDANTEGRSLGFLGEPGVNVLQLNLALDQQP